MGEKSTVVKAHTISPSVRTTIPERIAQDMKLKVGDVLDWEISSQQNGRKIMKLKKLE